jgi:uncharacterized membrane protein
MDADAPGRAATQPGTITWPGILLGIGLGGLFDGIVLHQILQWHHLLSAPIPPVTLEALERNTLADGLFHAAAWVATAAGVALLAARWSRGSRPELGSLVAAALVGWGLFNVVEGLIDHHLLGLHHVRPGPDELVYDLAFLAWGAAMLVAGVALSRVGTSAARERRAPRPGTARSGR